MMVLWGCAAAPAPEKSAAAPAPAMMDISQVPGPQSLRYVSESAAVAAPSPAAPSAEDLARAAMRKQTEGMAPGAVAGGPKNQVVVSIPESVAPETGGAKPAVTIPALQPEAESLPPQEGESWKKPLPPLPSLEGK
jgi:hypothetical protein